MKNLKYFPLIILAIVLVACSFSVNVPTVDTSTTQTFEVNQPVVDGMQEANMTIEMGGGRLNVSSGSSKLIEGTVIYNVADWKPSLSVTNSNVRLTQNNSTNIGIPTGDIKNDWNLKLGSLPMSLKISAGAYEGTIDLTGLALTNLEINDGASKATVRFDSLNPSEMQSMAYKTGASSVSILGIGNANTTQLSFESGAGDYTLDFSGNLQKDLNAKITSGVSQVKIIVPKNTHTIVNLNGGLSNVDAEGTWTMSGSQYEAAGSGKTITINIEMAVGNLVLQQN
ncbi:MAG: toast rack family protein [Anaerolineaceae bacterium]